MITNNPNNPNNKEIQKEWTIAASLEYLCVNFLKGKQELRAGITLSMITYLQQLQTHIIRKEMNIIIERILSLLVNQSMKFYHSLPELLQAHLCVTTMLDDGLRGHLGEEGQYKMADTLIHVLTIDGYNEYILILALRQLRYNTNLSLLFFPFTSSTCTFSPPPLPYPLLTLSFWEIYPHTFIHSFIHSLFIYPFFLVIYYWI